MSFWGKLTRPVWVMAPMEGVTDTTFRQIVAKAGKPDVFFTEFTNVDAIVHAIRDPQNSVLDSLPLRGGVPTSSLAGVPALQRLVYSEVERPIVAQIWGTEPNKFYEAARVIKLLGFDGIDINFGCPVRDVVKLGAGAAMICDRVQDSELRVQEIIAAAKEGGGGLPVSVKTRIGFKEIVTEEWIGFLLTQGLAAITIHGRTAAQKSWGAADWGEIGKAVSLRDRLFAGSNLQSRVLDSHSLHSRGPAARARFASSAPAGTLMIGNGDIVSLEDARKKVEEYGVDGVMIGRGVLENPWVFGDQESGFRAKEERLELLEAHWRLWKKAWGGVRNPAEFRKYLKVYVRGFAGAARMRQEMMTELV